MGAGARAELDAEMRKVLGCLDARWIQAASHDLSRRLSQFLDTLQERRISAVLAWIPFFPGEIDLSSFISEQIGKREVYLPRVLSEDGMQFVAIDQSWASMTQSGYRGVPGPKSGGKVYDPILAAETVAIVPGLAFDREGARLGRGGGYYARFLQSGLADVVTVGVCWSLQIVQKIPSQNNVLYMDWVCTEREIFEAQ